jgi:hypothetical protein
MDRLATSIRGVSERVGQCALARLPCTAPSVSQRESTRRVTEPPASLDGDTGSCGPGESPISTLETSVLSRQTATRRRA